MQLPTNIRLEVVTPEGLLLRDEVDEVIAPGSDGYFGVRPGHTPMLAALGAGGITFHKAGVTGLLTCFWGFCEVLPDRVSILAEIGERAEDIDVARAEQAKNQAQARLRALKDEAGYEETHNAYVRAVTRLSVAARQRQP
jgi:F-type H+-transporting ATPase subunit epsilon